MLIIVSFGLEISSIVIWAYNNSAIDFSVYLFPTVNRQV